jgi:predicted enzyme related to lactoylglutathione lyase
MTSKPKPSAVVFAKDVARVTKFYEELLSMAIVHADEAHIVLDAETFQLVVHAIPKAIAESFEVTIPPQVREEMPVKLCLPVSSIAAARSRAQALGGMVKPEANEWQARSFRACDGYDPEAMSSSYAKVSPDPVSSDEVFAILLSSALLIAGRTHLHSTIPDSTAQRKSKVAMTQKTLFR